MKILDIRLKNLNSLRGEWHIDLTNREYTSEGIFAITGPTGAGKTTIFDAVCLALYAQTPRLGRIGGQSNEIMSKHTKECYAQVVFETCGEKYICSWRQNKLGKNSQLQTAKHVLSHYSGEIISAQKLSTTLQEVERITGMNFKQFTQAMMLEQGGFDAFLSASSGERSKILELITGTEIYGRISTEVYERTSREERKLDDIKIRIDSMKPNDDFGSDEEIHAELSRLQAEQESLTSKHKAMKEAIDWLRGIQRLKNDRESNNRDEIELMKRIDMFSSDNAKLEAALRANEIIAFHRELNERRRRFETLSRKCEVYKRDLMKSTAELSDIETGKMNELEIELKRIRRDTTESPEAIRSEIESLIKIFEERKEEALKAGEEKAKIQLSLQTAQAKFQTADEKYKAVLDHYEEAVLGKARMNLKPGEPCPVCGSVEHPAVNHVNPQSESESIRPSFEAVSKEVRIAQSEYTMYRTQYEKCIKDFESKSNLAETAKRAVFKACEPLGIFDMASSKDARDRVRAWANAVRKLEDDIESMRQQMLKLRPKIEELQKYLNDNAAELEILKSELECLESDFKIKLAEKNFADENQFKASILSDNELKKLQDRKQYLEDNKRRLEALKNNIIEKLNTEEAKAITQQTLEELNPLFDEDERIIAFIQKKTGALEATIDSRRRLKAELEELNEKYKLQAVIYSDWSALNELIGNKNGNRYRIFAQRVTLGMMINLANIQLSKLSGRYELIADTKENELELSVRDREQANAIRPTSNLSGGERFIISLALALGLSQLSGSKARVDSLFLDEGFGSLDDEALSTALEALGEVRREGRMIGIISHVQALKERIAAQINVIPKREGTSIIEGPGCTGK